LTEIEMIIARGRYERRIRATSSPRECFVINHDYVAVFCDPYMADEYYENAKKQLCLECYYFADPGCWKPFGLRGQLKAIIAKILWRLNWKWHLPLLNWCYCYKFRLDRRKEDK
jgi:hypothetical protein